MRVLMCYQCESCLQTKKIAYSLPMNRLISKMTSTSLLLLLLLPFFFLMCVYVWERCSFTSSPTNTSVGDKNATAVGWVEWPAWKGITSLNTIPKNIAAIITVMRQRRAKKEENARGREWREGNWDCACYPFCPWIHALSCLMARRLPRTSKLYPSPYQQPEQMKQTK